MPYVLARLLDAVLVKHWRAMAVALALAFGVGWVLMWLYEPDGAKIKQAHDYWWFFYVCGTTVGFGDLYPVTTGGRIGAVIDIAAGVTAGLALFAELVLLIGRRRRRRMTGDAQLHLRNHLVVFGYSRDELTELIRQVRGDRKCAKMPVVACYFPGQFPYDENPDPQLYHVVNGANQAFAHAHLAYAAAVYVKAPTDDASFRLVARIVAHLKETGNTQAHLIMGLTDTSLYLEMQEALAPIRSDVELVAASNLALVADAIQNPGVAAIYQQLASNLDTSASLYRVDLPAELNSRWSWRSLALHLLEQGYTLLCVAPSHAPGAPWMLAPAPDTAIVGGSSIVVIGPERPTWQQLTA